MTVTQAFSGFLVALVATAAAPDGAIDPTTIKGKVTIEPGKKLAVRFEQQGDQISHPKVVEKVSDSPPTITLEFLKKDDNLILATKNPFPKDLMFRALARHKGRKEYVETSIAPVKAGLLGLELWQEPIEELVLFEFRLLDEKP